MLPTRRLVTQRDAGAKGARTRALGACVAGACALGPSTAAAQIFAGAQASGDVPAVIVLSNFRSELTPDLLIEAPVIEPNRRPDAGVRAAVPVPGTAARRLPAPPPGIAELIDAVALQVQLAPALLHAVVAAESAYDTRALSPRGAIGLMQLMPATARRFGAHDAYSPRANLMAGAQYLKWLLALFDGDLELALAAYNAGEQAVIKAGHRVPPYAETQAYVPRVLGFLACADQAACRALQSRRAAP